MTRAERWRQLRVVALERAGYRCEVCKGDAKLHAHHVTYENLGQETLADIQILCVKCHREEHRKHPDLKRPCVHRSDSDSLVRVAGGIYNNLSTVATAHRRSMRAELEVILTEVLQKELAVLGLTPTSTAKSNT